MAPAAGKPPEFDLLDTDVLIVGGGLAALRAAIESLRFGCRVMLLTKGIVGRGGSSAITSGGYSAALAQADPDDTPSLHLYDTLKGGAGLNDPELARVLCEEAVPRFFELMEWGVEFERDASNGKIRQYPSGDHSRARVAVCAQQAGTGITLPLRARASGATFLEGMIALDLLREERGVTGAIALEASTGAVKLIRARSTILATGGIGQLYSINSNPGDVTGDGLALAFRAGGVLTDLEFVQFYPWRLISHGPGRMPIQPSTFACGAVLRNADGERFMHRVDRIRKEATSRDLAARGIFTEIIEGRGVEGGVVLDISALPPGRFKELNPRVVRFFDQRRIDPTRARMILAPEAHFHMGGVVADPWGRTPLPGLYVAGEVMGGIHGGNRLDSNAIPDTQVFGRRAGQVAAEEARDRPLGTLEWERVEVWDQRLQGWQAGPGPKAEPARLREAVQSLMTRSAGILRDQQTMLRGLNELSDIDATIRDAGQMDVHSLPKMVEVGNMVLAASLILEACLARRESRAAHYRTDYPQQDDEHWLGNLDVSSGERGKVQISLRRREVG